MKNRSIILETDMLNEAIQALYLTEKMLRKVLNNIYYWKWAIVAIHNSLQGFMVCALSVGDGLDILDKKSMTKWLNAYHNNKSFSNEKLDCFSNLYAKIKSTAMKKYIYSKQYNSSAKQERKIKKLNELRNKFIHFKFSGWHVEVSGMPGIIEECVSIIEFLVFESGNMMLTESKKEHEIKHLIANIKSEISKINTKYIKIQKKEGGEKNK